MEVIDRNFARGARAARVARASGASAMEAASAMIEAAFDQSAAHIDFKEKVAAILAMGAAHPANKARYAARAERLCGKSLDAAIATVEHWHKTERKAFQIASLFVRPPRLPLIILAELRLILRLFRRRGMADQFPLLIESLCEPPPAVGFLSAAE